MVGLPAKLRFKLDILIKKIKTRYFLFIKYSKTSYINVGFLNLRFLITLAKK